MLLRLSGDERGFTMVTVIGALLVVTLLAITALSYAQSDLPRGAKDRDRKIAYSAAEAGAQNYAYYLSQDPNFWSKCDAGTVPAQINQRWNGVGADPRTWVQVPGATNAWYTIELLPANGQATCSTAAAQTSMIDNASGTFSIRTTGRVGLTGRKRSIVTTFKRQSLLDFIYYTDYETRSPILYPVEVGDRLTRMPDNCGTGSNPACRDLKQWAIDECKRYYGDKSALPNDGKAGSREDQVFNGQYVNGTDPAGPWNNFDMTCNTINFVDGDVIAGPLHTNDEFACSPTPDFGRTAADKIETSSAGQTASPATGYRSGCTPNFIGTHVRSAVALNLPPSNGALYPDTAANYRFVGRTQITMSGATMTVTGQRQDGTVLTNSSMAIPADGVVYVSNQAVGRPVGTTSPKACGGYNVINAYKYQTDPADGCGNLEIKGNYTVNVTFTAENDIVVMDDTTRPAGSPPSPDVMLGLISSNFIRVYHPVTGCGARGCNFVDSCSNNGGPGAITIDAAILSVNHSFVNDNWFCGNNLGNLTVRGAIAQRYRGAVGRGSSGYIKNYSYDDRFKFRSPPKFLDPVEAAWRVQTYNEQVPAR